MLNRLTVVTRKIHYNCGLGDVPDQPMQPIVFAQVETLSFRQIDQLNGLSKGASFRLFKTHRQHLEEGIDYFYLPEQTHRAFLDELKVSGRIYVSTVHLVLLTRQGYQRLQSLAARERE